MVGEVGTGIVDWEGEVGFLVPRFRCPFYGLFE